MIGLYAYRFAALGHLRDYQWEKKKKLLLYTFHIHGNTVMALLVINQLILSVQVVR